MSGSTEARAPREMEVKFRESILSAFHNSMQSARCSIIVRSQSPASGGKFNGPRSLATSMISIHSENFMRPPFQDPGSNISLPKTFKAHVGMRAWYLWRWSKSYTCFGPLWFRFPCILTRAWSCHTSCCTDTE